MQKLGIGFVPVLCVRIITETKGIMYYTLLTDPEIKKGYRKVLVNENINWIKHVLFSAHWSSGKRENKDHLPDKRICC